ncbi:hypothetical protein EIN_427860 [Entamoeba invadens IP1]|uniref:Uncharacterized protein n=1 Tax=Entamoeba invadens IP1 TaxID=370355 RepID=A0A0A1UEW6_ENTIV|nr:hypothetical protein EIN_427860 [Entamoeba invadens IP1]ELP95120.1 hypothetical protein EIN_427860 [Entamoeba invadens IP1]|eukprot:XP_004261891.1 hypothetical protein EIN_427860 [Entamoeba invadens IP1]
MICCSRNGTSHKDGKRLEKPEWTKEVGYKRKYQFREKRNYQVSQQGIFLAIINQYFEIDLLNPIKRSNVATQILRIDTLKRGEDIIHFNSFLEERCQTLFKNDIANGVSTKTAMRRLETNKVAEGLHLLIDILLELGYFFTSKVSKGVNGFQRIETVKIIHTKNRTFNRKMIEEIGQEANAFLFKELSTEGRSQICVKNQELQGLLCE